MSKKLSAIEKRRQDADLLVREYYGEIFKNMESIPVAHQPYYKVKALIAISVNKSGMTISDEDLESFVYDILAKAKQAGLRANRDYIYSLTRRTKLPIYGASAFAEWKRKQLIEKERQAISDEKKEGAGS